MKITADTNVLVRALVQDDPKQAKSASALLEQAELMVDSPAVARCKIDQALGWLKMKPSLACWAAKMAASCLF